MDGGLNVAHDEVGRELGEFHVFLSWMRWARTGSRHTSGVLATPPSTSRARRNAGRVPGWTAHSGRDPRGTAGSVAQRQCRVSGFKFRAGWRAGSARAIQKVEVSQARGAEGFDFRGELEN